MENQRTLLYVSLAMVLFLVWSSWQQDYGPQPVQSTEQSSTTESSSQASNDLPGAVTAEAPKNDIPGAERSSMPEMKAMPETTSRQAIHVLTDKLEVLIDSRGGDIKSVKLLDYPQSTDEPDQPYLLMGGENDKFFIAQSGLVSADAKAPSHHAIYRASQTEYQLGEGKDSVTVDLHWQENDVQVVKSLTFNRGSYVIDVNHKVMANSPWSGSQYSQFIRAEPQSQENQFIYTYTGGVVYNDEIKYEKVEFSDMASKTLDIEGSTTFSGGWAAMIQHYFLGAWLPGKDESNFYYANQTGDNRYLLGLRSSAQSLKAGESVDFSRRIWVGPKLQNEMEVVAPGLELTVDYGFLHIIGKPLFWLLEFFYGLFANWGWAIIFLTITVKLVFYKLSEASYRSMAKMRKLGPRLKSLKERYGDDRQAMSKAMMDMYKTEKINPLGGCFPMLVQIPVFIALYWVLLESVEMRNAPFMLWLDNLSAKDPYFVLPLLMGVSMYVQFKLNPAPMDPIQQKVFQFMPIIFTVFFAFFPSGLVLYWVVNNILSIAQQYVITKRIEAGEEK